MNVRLKITGRVQGVAYRAWCEKRAEACSLVGWVRNEPDGSVSAVVQGIASSVEKFMEECWSGPPLARVDEIVAVESTEDPRLRRFEIR